MRPVRRPSIRPRRSPRRAHVHLRLPLIVQAAARMAIASGEGSGFSSTTRERRCTSIDGMSMATGQASKQAPQSVEA